MSLSAALHPAAQLAAGPAVFSARAACLVATCHGVPAPETRAITVNIVSRKPATSNFRFNREKFSH